MADELSGKIAVVTGGASGLGEGIVEKFIAEGAKVTIADIDEAGGAALAERLGDAAEFVRVDVAVPAELASLVDHVVATHGRIDVMVNNAGVSGAMHPSFLDDDLADFRRVMDVNMLGAMAGTQAAARRMVETGGGSIVNISSIGGIQAGGGVMSYRASKAAIIHFSKSVAIELAEHNIRVNTIAPGNIPTPILAASAAKMGADVEAFTAMVRAVMAANRPLEREGTAEDVADAALFFASDRSGYVTGTLLPVDGGTVAGPPNKLKTGAGAQQGSGQQGSGQQGPGQQGSGQGDTELVGASASPE